MTLAPGSRVGPYAIGSPLGAGGMGEVWRARDTRLERDVALKVLPAEALGDDTARARLLREARLASKLNHANICTIHDVGEADGQAYIAMELVEGQSLSERLAGGALPAEQVVRYGQHLASALAHAHERGVVHRDLKSANAIVTPEGQVKVLDFGLARRLAGEELEATTMSRDSITAPGLLAGTLAYMAPEQLLGQAADTRADIWALGVVLYEMVGGRRPFEGKTGFELSSAILKETPAPLPRSVPVPLTSVIEKCLAKDPGERYQRGAEVRAALEAVQAGTAPVSRPAWTGRPPRRRWLLATSAGTLALLAVIAVLAALDAGGVRSRLLGGASASGHAVRLAVLPFANLSGDPEQEFLSDGLTQEMIAQLGRLHPGSLSVIARTSVMRYKQANTPIDQIGRELGVDYVLEGSAQREAGRIHITAELIKVVDQTQLWADSYEREMAGVLSLQSDVARSVAKALALTLLPAEQARLASVRTVNPEAYDLYLKGSQQWPKLTPPDLDTAQQYFELALKKDPDYAPAYAGLAIVWACRQQMAMVPPAVAGPKAKAAALKAVDLDEANADAHAALGDVLTWTDWNWPAAEREFQRAIELNPNLPDPRVYYSHLLFFLGRPKEAMAEIDRALALDPLNIIFRGFYQIDLLFARRYEDLVVDAQTVLRIEPSNLVALGAIWPALARLGRNDEAIAAATTVMKAQYGSQTAADAIEQGFSHGGYTLAMRRGAEALAAHAATGQTFVNPTDVAMMYAEAHENAPALDWLEKAYDAHDANMPYIGAPFYDRLRDEPRYQALLRRMNLPVR